MFEKVIIAVDSRSAADDAVTLVKGLASAHASLTLAHVELAHVDVDYLRRARGVAAAANRDSRVRSMNVSSTR